MTGVLIAFALGALTVGATFILAFRLAARYQRTGLTEAPPKIEEPSPEPANPEAAVLRRVTEDAIKRGAAALMLEAERDGIPMTHEQAEHDAREMLRSQGPLGGVS